MVLKYGPFNGTENAWDAYDFAEFFKLFFGNGVFPNPSNNLQILAHENMQTKVSIGVGFVEGHKISNTSEFILQHDVADGVLKRIDRVVMRANFLQNKGEIIVKKGTPASSPVAPSLVRNTDYYELALADVLINNGATVITQANITDQRLNTTLCGVVATNITQLDTTTLFNQYQSWLNETTGAAALDIETFKTAIELSMNQWIAQEQQDFETWFATLQVILDGDVATNLTNRVATLENKTKIATTAQAQAGTLDNVLMTPLKTSQAINALAVPKSGGTFSGDLYIRTSTPSISFASESNLNRYQFFANVSDTTDNGMRLRNVETGADIMIWNSNGNVSINHNGAYRSLQDVANKADQAFQQANDIKTKWAGVIGNPLLSSDTQAQLESKTQTLKNTLASNITAKGVTASGTETLNSLANKVSQITQGPKILQGISAVSFDTHSFLGQFTAQNFSLPFIDVSLSESADIRRISVIVINGAGNLVTIYYDKDLYSKISNSYNAGYQHITMDTSQSITIGNNYSLRAPIFINGNLRIPCEANGGLSASYIIEYYD